MNFLDGGLMLAVIVGLWLLVYLPSLGNKNSAESEGSTRTRNSRSRTLQNAKMSANGVSNSTFRNKNIRTIRAIFLVISLASIAGIAYGIATAFENPMQLTISAVSLAVLTVTVTVVRAGGKKTKQKQSLSTAQVEAQRRRMAYLIRESALIDTKPDELFDERAWSQNALPESLLNRNFGAIDTSNLADIVSFEAVKSSSQQKKLESEELNLILKRRRSGE